MAYCAYCGSHVAQVSFVPCASCGNPTNGAPPRPAARAATNPAAIIIGVIAAALVLLFILSILAAIAIPNLITAMERAKQKRTMANIRAFATSIEAQDPSDRATPSVAIPKDGWETEMRYMPLEGGGYVIISAGNDKTFDVDSPDQYTPGEVENFDCDIVFANGSFVQYPKNITGGGQ